MLPDELDAVRVALDLLEPGDVTTLFCQNKDVISEFIRSRGATPVNDSAEMFTTLRDNVRVPA